MVTAAPVSKKKYTGKLLMSVEILYATVELIGETKIYLFESVVHY